MKRRSTVRNSVKARVTAVAALAAASALALSACGGSSAASGADESAISSDRCQANKDAGAITYLSGYQFQSSASILEYVAADKLGYFKDLCLDVTLKPGSGDTAQNTKLLASGQATVSAINEQDLIQARANGIDITGISSYSNAGLDVLMTNKDITNLKQLDGKVVGHKGFMPATVQAMLVKEGVDVDSLKLVKQGYDPTVLPRKAGGLEALTGFASNEPNILKAKGDDVTVWQPADYNIPSSLGAMAVNPKFAKDHPEAVQDILRAAIHAYEYCAQDDHVDECVGYAADASGATYDKEQNAQIWKTEVQMIKDHPTPDQPLGGIDPKNVSKLVDLLHSAKIVKSSVTADSAAGWFTNDYIDAIFKDDKLVWPAP